MVAGADGEGHGRHLRCSDRDRDGVAERLRQAAGEGRLDLAELDERLEATYAARTYAQLDAVVADLPDDRLPGRAAGPVVPADQVLRLSAPLSDRVQRGRWVVPPRIEVSTGVGTVRLDFVDAVCLHEIVDVRVQAVAGAVVLVVPDGWSVRLDGVTSGGTVKDRVRRSAGSPLLRVSGHSVLGTVLARPPRRTRWLPR